MKFYYTNANTYLEQQNDPNKSVGGFLSSTVVPNDMLGNLFSAISQYGIQKRLRETKAIVLKNDFQYDVADIELFIDWNNPNIQYKIAAVQLNKNDKDEYYMELIDNMRSIPYYAEFKELQGEDNVVSLGDLKSGEFIGLWIQRTFSYIDEEIEDCANLIGEEISEIGKLSINLSWQK